MRRCALLDASRLPTDSIPPSTHTAGISQMEQKACHLANSCSHRPVSERTARLYSRSVALRNGTNGLFVRLIFVDFRPLKVLVAPPCQYSKISAAGLIRGSQNMWPQFSLASAQNSGTRCPETSVASDTASGGSAISRYVRGLAFG